VKTRTPRVVEKPFLGHLNNEVRNDPVFLTLLFRRTAGSSHPWSKLLILDIRGLSKTPPLATIGVRKNIVLKRKLFRCPPQLVRPRTIPAIVT